MKYVRWALLIFVALFLTVWFGGAYAGTYFLLFQSAQSDFADPADFGGFPVEPVTLTTQDGVTISAWHVKAGGDKAVALFHGIGPDRRQMEDVAKCYLELGYSVLLADLRRHGKSGYAPTMLGLSERHDVSACMDFLKKQYAFVGAHGFSLGAAAVAFALRDRDDFNFAVLSSCYDTGEHALYDRLDVVSAPHWLAMPFIWISELRLGTPLRDYSPLDCMPFAKAPVLILGGDDEVILKAGETVDLFNRCIASKKQIHLFQGGHHVPIASGKEEEYRAVLRGFLEAARQN